MDNQRLNLALTIKRVFHQIFVLEPLQLLRTFAKCRLCGANSADRMSINDREPKA